MGQLFNPDGGDIFYIQNTNGGIASEKEPLEFSAGDISAASIDKMGYEMKVFKFAPNTSMEVHAADVEWISYVLSGNGKLTLAGEDKKVISTISFKPGDIIAMEPNTFHGWQVGNEEWISVWVRKK